MSPISIRFSVVIATGLVLMSSMIQAKQLRDPTMPGSGARVSSTSVVVNEALVLNSIVNGVEKVAVINNKILTTGDVIQGRKIAYIGQNYVNFTDGSKLQLFKSITGK
ncbi:MSHA biogenesis protein MshK [Shewanella maritima]|uniref:MSHA biogenesis protein MshK n=1 Tax=Shewanella maritima TaxID=2520507 RepID=UPI00373632CB